MKHELSLGLISNISPISSGMTHISFHDQSVQKQFMTNKRNQHFLISFWLFRASINRLLSRNPFWSGKGPTRMFQTLLKRERDRKQQENDLQQYLREPRYPLFIYFFYHSGFVRFRSFFGSRINNPEPVCNVPILVIIYFAF